MFTVVYALCVQGLCVCLYGYQFVRILPITLRKNQVDLNESSWSSSRYILVHYLKLPLGDTVALVEKAKHPSMEHVFLGLCFLTMTRIRSTKATDSLKTKPTFLYLSRQKGMTSYSP